MTEFVTVRSRDGVLRGATHDGIHSFKGIAYGASTEGERRFSPPQPPSPWSGVRDALTFGPRSPQWEDSFAVDPRIKALFTPPALQPMGEDCLRLNVWTPGLDDGARRPVLLWLHGGAFITGSGADPWTDGESLARREDVVVVTLNHRLGAFGYLHLEDVAGPAFAGSSLAGMLDIVAALTWVRDNAAAFGGDGANVTIFGESGGGAKVAVLMAMPAARGLFHRAVMQSGPALAMAARDDGSRSARGFLAHLGVRPDEARRLLTLPMERLLEAQIAVLRDASRERFAERRRHGFNPVQGQPGFPGGPFEPEAPALSAHIPLLIGTNRHEMALFVAMAPWLESLGSEDLVERLTPFVDDAATSLVRDYRALYPAMPARDLFIAIVSDQNMTIPSLQIADRKVHQNGAPVFVYLFTAETPVLDGRLRSTHVLEIPYVFANTGRTPFVAQTASHAALSRMMSGAWANFARNGTPTAPGLPEWPAYDRRRRPTMIFDETCQVADDPHAGERAAWAALGIS